MTFFTESTGKNHENYGYDSHRTYAEALDNARELSWGDKHEQVYIWKSTTDSDGFSRPHTEIDPIWARNLTYAVLYPETYNYVIRNDKACLTMKASKVYTCAAPGWHDDIEVGSSYTRLMAARKDSAGRTVKAARYHTNCLLKLLS